MFKIVDGVRINLTQTEIEELEASRAAQEARKPELMRAIRDGKLAETDWTHTSDHTPDLTTEQQEAWATYRQELRDAPTHAEWPNMEGHWPTPPE